MTLPGGPADKLGNRYEKWWTLSEFVRMLRGETDAIRIEDPGVEKAEFVVEVGSQRELHQAKRSNPNGKWSLAELQRDGLLGAIGGQLTDNHDRFVFASGSDAPELSELCDSARSADSVDEFEQRFLEAKARKRSFGAVCGAWACDVSTAVRRLRQIQVRTISEYDLEEKVRWGVQALFLAHPTGVVEALRGIADDSVHRRIRRQDLAEDLSRRGYALRRLISPAAAGDSVRTATDGFLEPARRKLIQRRLVPRTVAETLLSRLGEGVTDTVLTGRAGSGKTACVLEVVDALRNGDVPVLAFRLDRFVQASATADLGRRLGLEESPILVLAAAASAAARPGVLIVDQLDAISTVSGRTSAFDLVQQLIIEARVARGATIHVVVVCREFDWRNDSRLRQLLPDSPMQLDVTEFTMPEVRELLTDAGFRPQAFKDRQLRILALPQNLSLFLEADFDASTTPTFATATEIFGRYWDAKREAVEQRSPDSGGHWMAVMKKLCRLMTDSQQLSVAREQLDDHPVHFVSQLASEGVIAFDGRRCGFGHESFFDYVFARVFVTEAQPIAAFLKASEQHLFRRAQVRQVLAYLRDLEHLRYARDLRELLSDDAVRAHLKDLAFALLAEVGNPTDEEWAIWETWIVPELDAIETGRANRDALSSLAWRRFFGSRPWFADIDRRGIIADWLAADSDAIADMAVNYLWVHQRHSPERVAELLEPYAEQGGRWGPRLRSLMERAEYHTSRRFFDLFLRLLDNGTLDDARDRFVSNGTFGSMLYSLGEERPEWVSEVVAHRLRRLLAIIRAAGGTPRGCALLGHDAFAAELLTKFAQRAPAALIEHVLPVVLEISDSSVVATPPPRRDAVWSMLVRSAVDGEDACLSELAESLAARAGEDANLRDVIADLRRRNTHTANYLLMAVYRGGAARCADEASTLLWDEPWRFECGFSDSPNWCAMELIRAVVPHCTAENREKLEAAILNYVAPFESTKDGYREHGRARFDLLSVIPAELRSTEANARFAELARKFREPAGEPREVVAGFVRSPIGEDEAMRMTDDQWLQAIAKYDSELGGFSSGELKGGAWQLAQVLEQQVKEDPERFARLSLWFPVDAHPRYLELTLSGLKNAPIVSDLKLRVCRKAVDDVLGPCGKAVADVLGSIDDELPEEAVQMLEELATEHEDPNAESWQDDAGDGKPYWNGDPHFAGINTTRGRAAEAIRDLIIRDSAYVGRFSAAVERMVRDPSASVRACVAGTLGAIALHDPGRALSLFLRMDLAEDRLLTTPHVRRFIRWGLRDGFSEVRPILERMLRSGKADAGRFGARLAAVAALLGQADAEGLVDEAMRGGAKQRLGIAEIASSNISARSFRDWCEAKLSVLFGDADSHVRREAASWCRHVGRESLGEFGDLILEFGDSRAFDDNPWDLLTALEESRGGLPGTTCEVCGWFFARLADEGGDSGVRGFTGGHTVSKLVFRTYHQHMDDEWTKPALDLIDRLCLEGNAGAMEGFEGFER